MHKLQNRCKMDFCSRQHLACTSQEACCQPVLQLPHSFIQGLRLITDQSARIVLHLGSGGGVSMYFVKCCWHHNIQFCWVFIHRHRPCHESWLQVTSPSSNVNNLRQPAWLATSPIQVVVPPTANGVLAYSIEVLPTLFSHYDNGKRQNKWIVSMLLNHLGKRPPNLPSPFTLDEQQIC